MLNPLIGDERMNNTLYRDPVKGKIAGVCAGIAEYLGIEIWIVRIFAVTAFLIGFAFFATIAYIAAILMLDKKPKEIDVQNNYEHNVKQKPWQQGRSAKDLLSHLELEIKELEQQVARIETHVISREFELNRQFNQL